MRVNLCASNSIASVLPTCRVALVFGGGSLLAESVVVATSFFAAASLSFIASLLIGARIYRVRAPRPIDVEDDPAAHAEANVLLWRHPFPGETVEAANVARRLVTTVLGARLCAPGMRCQEVARS